MSKILKLKDYGGAGHGNLKYGAVRARLKAMGPGEGFEWINPPKQPHNTCHRWIKICGFVPIVRARSGKVYLFRPENKTAN